MKLKNKTCVTCVLKNKCSKNKPCKLYVQDEEALKHYTCEDCTKQDKCRGYLADGLICEKFVPIVWTCTPKGMMYLSFVENGVEVDEAEFKVFFDMYETLMERANLIVEPGVFGKIKHWIRKPFVPKTNARELFKRSVDVCSMDLFGKDDEIWENFAKHMYEL